MVDARRIAAFGRGGIRCRRTAVIGRQQYRRGFTLIELMIGLVLVVVLMGVGLPMFRSFILSQQLSATTADLRIALTTARSEAVKRNRSVQVLPSESPGGWSAGWRIPNPNGGDDILTHVQGAELTLTVSAAVQFSAMGRAVSAVEFGIDIGPDASSLQGCIQLGLDGGITSLKEACDA
jgi:type IV fimbrial biogenesis protein FimT